MYRSEQFAAFFLGQGNKPSSLNNYRTVLKRVDQAIGGLDEKLLSDGCETVERWAATTQAEPLKPYLKDVPSITRKYIDFFRVSVPEEPGADKIGDDIPEEPVDTGSAFQIEREMHRVVRSQLGALEPGLREADNGFEITVST